MPNGVRTAISYANDTRACLRPLVADASSIHTTDTDLAQLNYVSSRDGKS